MKITSGTVLEAGFISMTVFLLVEQSFASHIIVGEPPTFINEPQDVIITLEILRYIGGIKVNLILPCTASGDPTPTITWYRGNTMLAPQFVTSNGTLAINVTEGVGVTRTGVLYHCEATNIIGINNHSTTLRSRDVNVTYSFFDGFINTVAKTINVEVIQGQAVSVECDFYIGNPAPRIIWMNNFGEIFDAPLNDGILFMEGGRYLFFRTINDQNINDRFYFCAATHSHLSFTSLTRYTFSSNLTANTLKIYKPLGPVIALIKKTQRMYFAAASHDGTRMNGDPSTALVNCTTVGRSDVTILVIYDVVIYIGNVPQPIGDDVFLNITCSVIGTGVTETTTTSGIAILSAPVCIVSPPEGDPGLLNRELFVGNGSKTITCGVTGRPTPNVTWYFNGVPVTGIDGIIVTQNADNVDDGFIVYEHVLDITAPQVSHSGMYQCFAKNAYGQVISDDQRTWTLEFRVSTAPLPFPLSDFNTLAVYDELEGTLIILDNETVNFQIVAVVVSDPCPMVEWTFERAPITNGSVYQIFEPCSIGGNSSNSSNSSNTSLYTFNLTIVNFSDDTTGRYSAVFSNIADIVTVPFLVTRTVDPELISLDLSLDDDDVTPECLIVGLNISITCTNLGYPRPNIHFSKDLQIIDPGAVGFEQIMRVNFDTIHITEVAMEDEGLYSCELVGTEIRLPAQTIKFCSPPVILNLKITPVLPILGDALKLGCIVDGSPPPTVTWMKDNQDFRSNDNAGIFVSLCSEGMALVTIDSITSNDAGVYECFVTNDAATVNQSITVEVGRLDKSPFTTSIAFVALFLVGLGITSILLVFVTAMYIKLRREIEYVD